MAKEKIINENIITTAIDELLGQRYGDYAKYIIQDRALPDARDGLKPVQRRILYAMHKDGNTPDKGFRKSAKTVGLVIGNYHPHGDSSVYDAMVHLSQNWKMNYPLVEMHGNNGSIDDDPAAAMRYTEARLAKIGESMLTDIDKNTVSWAPNFDDTENEPTVLPAGYPNLLVNGSTGIAAGYATNIPPHNLGEVIDGTIYRINNPGCSLDTMMQIVKGPDFPTGGIVMGLDGIRDAFATGRGKVTIRAKVNIETLKTMQQIVVSEIPYEVVKSQLVKKIDEIRFNKDIDGILDVRDESDRNGLRVVIDVHKDMDANLVLNYLYKNTDLQVNYNYNMISIVDRRPMLLGLLEAIDAYIAFMKEVVLKRSQYELDKRINRCNILEGLIKAVSVLDEVIAIIRASKDKGDAKRNLIARFGFNEAQAEAIVTLRLYRLTNTDIFELKQEYEQLTEEMKQLNEIINNPEALREEMCFELKETAANFRKERLTEITEASGEITIDKMQMIANEHIVLTLSRDGYVKRVSMRSFSSSQGIPTGLKKDDQLIGVTEADTLDNLLAFGESGDYVCIPLYQLKEDKWKDVGQHISNYSKLTNAEKFVDGLLVKDFNSYCWIITASANGFIKRTALAEWQMQRTSKSSAAMNLTDGDKVISSKIAYEGDEVILVTREGFNLRYSIDEIPVTGVKAKGVKSVKLYGNDSVADMIVVRPDSSEVVYINEKAGAKRIKLSDIDVTTRATKGLLIAKKVKTNPVDVAKIVAGRLSDDLQLASDATMLDIKLKDVSLLNKESRFSAPLTDKSWYHYSGIVEVNIVDYPQGATENRNYEEFSLEV